MPFPEKKRVMFKCDPLIEVVCQLTFLTPYTDECFGDDVISRLHQSVKSDFPLFDIQKNINIEVLPETQTVKQEEDAVYEFSSLDKEWKIIFSKKSLVLATPAYKNWEGFVAKLYNFIENGLNEHFSEKKLERVGLRYKNVINRIELGLKGVPWGELLNETISAVHRSELGSSLAGVNTQINLQLENHPGSLSAHYGMVTHNETKESCYLIDSDFYIQGEIDYDDARKHLDVFNVKSRNFFQWAILERLFRALGPREIEI